MCSGVADFQREKKKKKMFKKYDEKLKLLGEMASYVLRNIACKIFIQEN